MPRHIFNISFSSKSINTNLCRTLYACSFVVASFFYIPVSGQRTSIDSLKKSLPLLGDSARVDCLNVLSLTYSYLNTDTAKSYSRKAYGEASDINYSRGMAMSLNNDAIISGHGLHDFSLQEKISLEAIQFYKNGDDQIILSASYMNLALALFCQGYFVRAADACNTVLQLCKTAGDKKGKGEALSVLGSIGLETGNYEQSFEYFNRSLEIFKTINDTYNTAILLAKIGDLYRIAGDQKTALNFYSESLKYPKGPSLAWHPLADLGDTYYALQQFDTSQYEQEEYTQTIKLFTVRSNYISYPKIRMAEMHLAKKEYNQSITLLLEELKAAKLRNEKNIIMRVLFDIGTAYQGKKDYKKTFYYAIHLLQNSTNHQARQYMRDAYRLIYIVYDQLGIPDSANAYYRKYTNIKDAVKLDEFSRKLSIYKAAKENEKKQAEIEILSNEKKISQQQLKLNEQQIRSGQLQRNILMAGVLTLVLLGFIIFRYIILKQKNQAHRHEIVKQELNLQKLASERTKSELQQKATELEMQALRAQMNPHFIFNSLNSINRFILQNNKAQASEYLTKFSKLVRLILQNSQHPLIPLENELEALQLYLELEALRFDHHFDYKITIDQELDVSAIKVPPLIIQPYAENAIWHGLMYKEEKGKLEIKLYEEDGLLCCSIADDGIGRKKATELKSKSAATHKSLGMQLTASRIAMMNEKEQPHSQINITDLVLADGIAGGTEVVLKIPVSYD